MDGYARQDPMAVARALYPALASGDRAALDLILSEDFCGRTTAGLPLGLGGTYQGPKAMRREFWGAIGRAYDVTARPADFAARPDGRIAVTGTYAGTARATGRAFEAAFLHTLTVRDGRITALEQLTDSAAWAGALQPEPASLTDVGDPAAGLTTVRYSVTDGLARIELLRPDAANAINEALSRDLRTAAARCALDRSARALLISGDGSRFCVGGDLSLFAGTPGDALPALLDRMITDYHVALATLAALPLPVVCAVQGAAAGGGLGLLWAADLVVAADNAKFATGYSAVGLSPDGANSWYLPRLVGPRRAAQMMLQNRVLGAAEALESGLVSEVVPLAELTERATAVATGLANGPARGLAAMRRLLRQSWTATLEEQFDAERRAIVAVAGTTDAVAGIAAFAAGRQPEFHAGNATIQPKGPLP